MLDGTLRRLKLVQGIGNRLAPSLDRQTFQLPRPLPAGDDLGDHFARAPTKRLHINRWQQLEEISGIPNRIVSRTVRLRGMEQMLDSGVEVNAETSSLPTAAKTAKVHV